MNNHNKEKNSSVYPCLVVNKLSLASVVFSVIFHDFISDQSSTYLTFASKFRLANQMVLGIPSGRL